MKQKDHICEMSVKRLYEARERQCEYSFQRYLEDIRERLEIIDEPEMWEKYSKFLEEQFTHDSELINQLKK